MKRDTSRTTREATGCFLMLVLGAVMCLGLMRIAVLAISAGQGLDQSGWWQSIVFWLLAPGAVFALVGWLTYGWTASPIRKKRG